MYGSMALAMGMLCGAAMSAADAAEERPPTPPLMRGTLWWVPAEVAEWDDARLDRAVQAQQDVGFDLLWILNATSFPAAEGQADVLERIYALADAKDMKVIIDLPQGGWHGKTPADELIATACAGVRDLHDRYGDHPSFHGWYLNYEVNPLPPGEEETTAYWRRVWKAITEECHRVAPESVVTISPFFLLDDTSRRGFVYLTPEQYAAWWGDTFQATGIDVLMLQDSGEHLAFFTLDQREPFFAAVAKAIHEAGAAFWLNVETGEADVASWDAYLDPDREGDVPWRFTPIEWLEQKLRLSAKYADNIVNWGYFPFMDPHRVESLSTFGGGTFGGTPEDARAAYDAYKAYYHRVKEEFAIEEVQQHVSDIRRVRGEIDAELARLTPVRMRVAPGLVDLGAEVTVSIEALADREPQATLEIHADHFARGLDQPRSVALDWREDGARHGLTVYRADYRFTPDVAGNWLLRWRSDIGGDIDVFTRHVAVLGAGYAICRFESTSHRDPRPEPDFDELRLPFDYWDHSCLWLANFVDQPYAQSWANATRRAREHGLSPTPMLFTDYFLRTFPKESRFAEASPAYQRTILSALREAWPLIGHDGEMRAFAAYSMGGGVVEAARDVGFTTISALCADQNWQDGSFRINQSGMPTRPYFISREDFRKTGDGGPDGLVGVSQCTRNPVLCRDYNCTYCLEPAWNEFSNAAGGRREVDDVHMSRMYDYFDAMLQNQRNNARPLIFSVGIEFNGVDPVIRDSNRLLMAYAARKAASEPFVFATSADITDYYRRRYTEIAETVAYQQDYFCGITGNGKPATFPDLIEIENAQFRAVLLDGEPLPYMLYDYTQPWDYPDWGNDDLPRNGKGYLEPGTYDRFAVSPAVVDTRAFSVTREDLQEGEATRVRLQVDAERAHARLPIGLWRLPCDWQTGDAWWTASNGARFVPVRAPFSGALNGVLVVDVQEGPNAVELELRAPHCEPVHTTVAIDDCVHGQVFARDSQVTAYLWPAQADGAALRIALPEGCAADAYVAPEGERQPLGPTETRFELPPGGWMRIVGLDRDKLLAATRAETP